MLSETDHDYIGFTNFWLAPKQRVLSGCPDLPACLPSRSGYLCFRSKGTRAAVWRSRPGWMCPGNKKLLCFQGRADGDGAIMTRQAMRRIGTWRYCGRGRCGKGRGRLEGRSRFLFQGCPDGNRAVVARLAMRRVGARRYCGRSRGRGGLGPGRRKRAGGGNGGACRRRCWRARIQGGSRSGIQRCPHRHGAIVSGLAMGWVYISGSSGLTRLCGCR